MSSAVLVVALLLIIICIMFTLRRRKMDLSQNHFIPAEDAKIIVEDFANVLAEIETGEFKWDAALEDVHMKIESRLAEIV